MIDAAVITAGGRVAPEFARVLGTDVKALARIRGKSMLEMAVEALREIGVKRIAVVGGDEVRKACAAHVEQIIPEANSGARNQQLALQAWEPQAPLLYLTSDMPYVNACALEQFLRGVSFDALAMPLTESREFERRFPGAPPFGITLAGEKVVNGGAFLIPAGGAPLVEALAMQFFDARKNPLQMARLAGAGLLARFLLRRVSVRYAERRAETLLKIPVRAVRGASPELAYDIDTLAEYEYAAAHA